MMTAVLVSTWWDETFQFDIDCNSNAGENDATVLEFDHD